jgi:mannose-6-phosphate isomerase-like protein (cupin superfamily)
VIRSSHDGPVPPEASAPIQIGGLGVSYLSGAASLGGTVALVEHTLEPRSLGAPVHTHTNEDEVSIVLEGTVGFLVGDQETDVGPGSTVVKPRGVPHAFWNATEGTARLLELISPGGFEGFFEEIAPIFPADGEPDEAGLTAFGEISARFGLKMELDSIPRLMERHGLLRV